MPTSSEPEKSDRRDFLKKACCVALGGALGAVPAAAGVGMYLDPLLRAPAGGTAGLKVRVTTLDALPGDGVPRQFKVMASQIDGWTKTPETAIGAVFLIARQRRAEAGPGLQRRVPACGVLRGICGENPELHAGYRPAISARATTARSSSTGKSPAPAARPRAGLTNWSASSKTETKSGSSTKTSKPAPLKKCPSAHDQTPFGLARPTHGHPQTHA